MLSCTPRDRLSEQVLAEGVKPLEAVLVLASKMALGLRKLCSKFKATLRQSPHASRFKNLSKLKTRLAQRGVDVAEESQSSVASEMEVEQVEALLEATAPVQPEKTIQVAASSKVDWAKYAGNLKALREAKQKEKETSNLPVATPARAPNKFALPPHVLETLKESAKTPVAPFPTAGDNADDDDVDCPDDTKKKPKHAKQKAAPKKNSKKKKDIVGPEEEKGLELMKSPAPSVQLTAPAVALAKDDSTGKAPLETTEAGGTKVPGAYRAGDFNKKRLEWIKEYRVANPKVSFKEASDKWMSSSDRISLLENMPMSEMKKRRFI